tara:strand:+ start:140 stop:334 length:195 start_codon:yes stop_codon:yes gene_type:complete
LQRYKSITPAVRQKTTAIVVMEHKQPVRRLVTPTSTKLSVIGAPLEKSIAITIKGQCSIGVGMG